MVPPYFAYLCFFILVPASNISYLNSAHIFEPMNSFQNNILVIAHRGASGAAPENTMASFREAIKLKVDMIELDVHQTVDGVVVVIHDKTVERTTNGKGKVKEMTFEEIQQLDAGSWFDSQFKNEKVPSLEKIIQEMNGEVKLLIEVKKGNSYYPDIEKNIMTLIYKYNAKNWCIIQSFETEVINNFKQIDPEVELHKLVTGNIPGLPLYVDNSLKVGSIFKFDEVASINPNFRLINKKRVEKIHKNGQKVIAWTVNDVEDMKKCIDMGVDGIITNYPDRLISVLDNSHVQN